MFFAPLIGTNYGTVNDENNDGFFNIVVPRKRT
jgi:hypothetical protein